MVAKYPSTLQLMLFYREMVQPRNSLEFLGFGQDLPGYFFGLPLPLPGVLDLGVAFGVPKVVRDV